MFFLFLQFLLKDQCKHQNQTIKVTENAEQQPCRVLNRTQDSAARHDIIPVEMKRCVVKLNEKDKSKKVERWQKISEVAAKQCGRDIIPEIKEIINIKKLCNLIESYDIVLVAYENEKENTLKEEIKIRNQ